MKNGMSAIPNQRVSAGNDIIGCRIVRSLDIVRGITVRSRSVGGNLGAAEQTIVGGNVSIYAEWCEKARQEAFELMLRHAAVMGASGAGEGAQSNRCP